MADGPSSSIDGQSRHPAVLQVCAESRKEGLRHYQQANEKRKIFTHPDHSGIKRRSPKKRNIVFINFAVDRFVWLIQSSRYDILTKKDYKFKSEVLKNIRQIDVQWLAGYGEFAFSSCWALLWNLSYLLSPAEPVRVRFLAEHWIQVKLDKPVEMVLVASDTQGVFAHTYPRFSGPCPFWAQEPIDFLWIPTNRTDV